MFLTGIYTESFSVLNLHRQTDYTQIHNLICYVTMNGWKSALHEVWSLESSTICPVCESSRSGEVAIHLNDAEWCVEGESKFAASATGC